MNSLGSRSSTGNQAVILGASKLQIPIIKAVQNAGYRAVVLDMNEKAPGVQVADQFFKVSTLDLEGVRGIVAAIQPVLMVTAATDAPMRILSQVAFENGLPAISPKTADKVTDKAKMMSALADGEVPLPRFETVTNFEEADLSYQRISENGNVPCIMKPVDSSGSRGVILVKNPSDLLEAFKYAYSNSRKGQVVISEYMVGPEVSVEIFVDQEGPKVITITDKLTSGYPHFVELGHCQPSCLPKQKQEMIKKLAIRAVEVLGIDQGPAHVEIIVCNHEEPKIVEIGARLGGDYISSHLVPLSTGVDLLGHTVRAAAGISEIIPGNKNSAAAIRFLTAEPGKVIRLEIDPSVYEDEKVKLFDIEVQVGDEVGEICGSNDRLGQIICIDETPNLALEHCNKVLGKINIVTQ